MADWVSVAKIVHKSKGEMTSYLSIGPIRLPQIKYTVEHQQIFKGNKTLPNEIFTGPDNAACGVTWLRENHTYLLVGNVDQHDKILTINYCFGLPLRDGAYGAITEWENIPESLATKLHNEDFGICTNKKR
uniref:NTR domain-containing protein n=1 Tax=Acrobeloides nanus TaxID=290746 RepID=A0A914DGE1_9BILA